MSARSSSPPPLVFSLPAREDVAGRIASAVGGDTGRMSVGRFPDGESRVRVESACRSRPCAVIATLDRPDPKILPLYLLVRTLRDLGATSVVLVAPYLPYLRQDRSFHEGEGVSARHVASLLSGCVDGVVTVDPHLHRIGRLDEVYSVPCRTVASAAPVARWIELHVRNPVVVGPDEESRAWTADVAARVGAPNVVLEKVRRGDRDVTISLADVAPCRGRVPVLLDDIISTGRTMSAALRLLATEGLAPGVCIGTHAVFAEGSVEELRAAGASTIATTNTIPHPTNAIDVVPPIAAALRDLLANPPSHDSAATASRSQVDP